MKRILALLLAAVMMLSLAACGGEGGSAETTEPAGPILGETSGNTYTNTYFGMGCTLDDSWIVANEDELAQIMGTTTEMLSEAALEADGVGYSFYASKEDGLTTLNIVMENLGKLYGMLLDEKSYAETSVEQLPAAFEAMGMTDVTTEITTVTFAGSEHTAIKLSGVIYDINFYETLVCVKQGSYIAVVTAASYYEDTTADILAQFQAA